MIIKARPVNVVALRQKDTLVAIHIIPASYRCDCGHVSHLSERTVREMREEGRRKPARILDSARDEHAVEFNRDGAVAVICPKLGRCPITGWE